MASPPGETVHSVTNTKELDNFLKKFNCIEGLQLISKYSLDMFLDGNPVRKHNVEINGVNYNQTVSQWSLAYISYKLILNSNDGRNFSMNHTDLMRANGTYFRLNDAFLSDHKTSPLFARLANLQFWWQDPRYLENTARNIILFNDLVNSYQNRLSLDFKDKFFEITGLDILEYFTIGWATYAYFILTKTLILQTNNYYNYFKKSEIAMFKEDNISKFLGIISAPYDKLRTSAKAANRHTLPGYEQYEFNPLCMYPVIEGDRRYSYYFRDFQYIVRSQ